ncbi:MAG: amino acid-binding domain protein [Frankiales bacterium]|nr:amino acid-binding domain protein [Frankiales bacterium]
MLSVAVTERSPGRAVDDFLLEWPSQRPQDELTAAVESVAGCRVLGLRRVATVPDENPALDLVTHVLWQPHRAVETLVDMVPSFAGADWAAVVATDDSKCLYGSVSAPAVLPLPPSGSGSRAVGFESAGVVGVTVPLPDAGVSLVAARVVGPAFSRGEIDELVRLTDLMVTLVRSVLPQSATPPSRLTARLLSVALQA